jgi:hypothetical protein
MQRPQTELEIDKVVAKQCIKNYYNPRADGAKRRAMVLIPPGYLHPGKRKH